MFLFSEKEDIEAYLVTFERIMTAHMVNKDRWPHFLAPQLSGRAQLAFAALPTEQSADYSAIKAAILALTRVHTRHLDLSDTTMMNRSTVDHTSSPGSTVTTPPPQDPLIHCDYASSPGSTVTTPPPQDPLIHCDYDSSPGSTVTTPPPQDPLIHCDYDSSPGSTVTTPPPQDPLIHCDYASSPGSTVTTPPPQDPLSTVTTLLPRIHCDYTSSPGSTVTTPPPQDPL
ncbi:hypothetical protein EMCRGX_G033284 [Ephydatia muelleri]